jgi:hypothetical protein
LPPFWKIATILLPLKFNHTMVQAPARTATDLAQLAITLIKKGSIIASVFFI